MSAKPVLAIVGASGFIGRALHARALSSQDVFEVVGTGWSHSDSLNRVDITNRDAITTFLREVSPRVVVWLAGTKDVKRCEAEEDYAWTMNVAPVRDLAQAIQQLGLKTQIRVVLFSSDYVFNGERGGYRDCQPPSPTTRYGRSKAEAEQVLESSGIQHTIVRASAVMGKGGSFFDWLVSSLTEGKNTELFEDVRFTPTPLLWLCRQTLRIVFLADKAPRVVHLCGVQEMSRFEFGSIVATVMGVKKDIVCPTKLRPSGDLFRPNLSLVASDGFRNDIDPAVWVREELNG